MSTNTRSDRTLDVPLQDRVLIGDTRTAALVSHGVIDWLCLPRFDSPPVFGEIVGGPDAGRFAIRPADPRAQAQPGYRPSSAVTETRWTTAEGRLLATDGMVTNVRRGLLPSALLVRRIEAIDAPVPVTVEFDPRRGISHETPTVAHRAGATVCTWGAVALALTAAPPMELPIGPATRIVVRPGSPVTIAMGAVDREPLMIVSAAEAWRRLEDTDRWWQRWAHDLEAPPLAAEAVTRSMITLRLLTYAPSGATVASPTTSLPERPGGGLNWDYRYTWPRDASIGVSAALTVGKTDEADAFLYWLLHAGRVNRPRMPPALRIDGRPTPSERTADGWPGYRRSRPVRFGNAAARQHQLDVYGWVVDAVWEYHRRKGSVFAETWRLVKQLADFVCGTWHEPDAGIWERRDEPRHYVFSRLMGWLALDRAIRLASSYRVGDRRLRRWERQRAQLAGEVRNHGFDSERGTYVQHYGSKDLDAALLLLPVIGFDPPGSPRVAGTIAAVRRELSAGGPLLYRSTDMVGQEAAFLPCSFWLVQALATIGQRDQAGRLFDELLALAGPSGLLAEEIDPETRDHLGNTPMALTHAALIQAANTLVDARRNAGRGRLPGVEENP